MAKRGDLKIEKDGSVYKYVEPDGWVYVGEIEMDIPKVGPSFPKFEPGEYSASEIGPELLSALWPGVDGAEAYAQWTSIQGKVPKGTSTAAVTIPDRQGRYLDTIVETLNARSNVELTPDMVVSIMEYMYPEEENPVDKFVQDYGFYGSTQYAFEPGGVWESALEQAANAMQAGVPLGGEEEPLEDTLARLGYYNGGAGGVGGEGGAAGVDWPPSAYFDLLRSQELPGGAGTPSGFYSAMSQLMNPLQGEDTLDFLNRMTQPGQYYPSTMYSLMGKSMLPMGLNMPEGFYGMLGDMMPSGIAPGTEIPSFDWMGGLGAAPMPELGAYLANLLQGNPELALALMEASIGMQQEAAMPFLPLLLGPGAQGGSSGGMNDFLASMLGGV